MSFLLEIKPNVVSRDLSGYVVGLYGYPKSGKTSTACQFDKPLLLAFEVGYNAIPGAMAVPMHTWADVRKVMRELKKAEVKSQFKTIVIDTLDLAYEMAESAICQKNGVEHITDVAWGKGTSQAYDLLNDMIVSLTKMGYGVVMISHATQKSIKAPNGMEYTKTVPTLTKKALAVFENSCDIYGYVASIETDSKDQFGLATRKSVLYTRASDTLAAGNRFANFPPVIDLTYAALCEAIANAVDSMNPTLTTDEKFSRYEEDLDYDALIVEFNEIKDAMIAQKGGDAVPLLVGVIETYLGEGVKIADTTKKDASAIQYIINDLKEM